MAADQGGVARRHRARRRRDPRRRATSSIAPCRPIPERRSCRASRPRFASGATPTACRTSSPPSMDDAARALGYLHASERLFQMEFQRRVGQGRLAEIFGAERLGVDKFIRTLGFYREAESSFGALTPWAQKRLEAYADGVNAFLDSHKDALPPEFLIVGDRPEPWKPADSLVWGKLMSLELSHNYELEALRAHLGQKLGPDEAAWMFPGMTPGAPVTTLPAPERDARESPERRGRDRRPDRHPPWGVERVGGRRIAHRHRKADPRQRSAPRHRGADPLVSRAHRHARGLGQGRNRARAARRSARAERLDRLGLHDRGHRRAGPLHRDRRSVRSVEIPDAGRFEAVRDARGDDPRQGRRRREADRAGDEARPRPLRRQRQPRRRRRSRQSRQRSPSPASAIGTPPSRR